jgi:cytidylate kinase
LRGRGDGRIYARVLAEIEERDRRDSTRSVAPLMPAPDAIVIDTTGMTIDAVFAEALAHVTAGAGTDARS